MSISDFPGFTGALFGRPLDPDLAAMVATRLRVARGSAIEAAATLRGLGDGWQGPSAEAALREIAALADGLARWADRSDQLAGSAERLVARITAELARRGRLHEAVLAALGRLATLPGDAHREVSLTLARLSNGHDWQGQLTPIGPALHPLTVRLPRVGAVGWDSALAALRSFLP